MMYSFLKAHPFLCLLALNALSFCIARAYWYITGEFGADLKVMRPGEDEGDEFLDNSSIEAYFCGIPIVEAAASHGNTVDMADQFLEAWRSLNLDDNF